MSNPQIRHPLQAFDLHLSFDDDQPGFIAKRVMDARGKLHLDETVWAAGFLAYTYLAGISEAILTPEGYRDWIGVANEMLDKEFFPDLLKMVDQGRVSFNLDSRAELEDRWNEFDWVERLMLLLQITDQQAPHWLVGDSPIDGYGQLIALALLWRVDSAVISEFLDGNGLIENVVDILALRDRLQLPKSMESTLNFAKQQARREQATRAVAARHAPGKRARTFVQHEWSTHQNAYNANKSAFARDYVRRVKHEFGVDITEKQLREVWLKDPPPTGKPDG
ncbi:hypothetical protein [Variovorax gossypii]